MKLSKNKTANLSMNFRRLRFLSLVNLWARKLKSINQYYERHLKTKTTKEGILKLMVKHPTEKCGHLSPNSIFTSV